jgi:hypothetical protein
MSQLKPTGVIGTVCTSKSRTRQKSASSRSGRASTGSLELVGWSVMIESLLKVGNCAHGISNAVRYAFMGTVANFSAGL